MLIAATPSMCFTAAGHAFNGKFDCRNALAYAGWRYLGQFLENIESNALNF
jgi:hypothetical protein